MRRDAIPAVAGKENTHLFVSIGTKNALYEFILLMVLTLSRGKQMYRYLRLLLILSGLSGNVLHSFYLWHKETIVVFAHM